jgi:hypothetical protein
VELELPNTQIDQEDEFNSSSAPTTDGYSYCGVGVEPGFDGTKSNPLMYDVHP